MGFNVYLKPFSWPFILIPNLPLDLINMLDSPVPYLIGVICDKNNLEEYNFNYYKSNKVLYFDDKLEFIKQTKDSFKIENLTEMPFFINLEITLNDIINSSKYYFETNQLDKYEFSSKKFYKSLYEYINSKLANKIEQTYIDFLKVK